MRGQDIRCPECGAGTRDVGRDYDLDQLGWSDVSGYQTIMTSVRCAAGHGLTLLIRGGFTGTTVDVSRAPSDDRSAAL